MDETRDKNRQHFGYPSEPIVNLSGPSCEIC